MPQQRARRASGAAADAAQSASASILGALGPDGVDSGTNAGFSGQNGPQWFAVVLPYPPTLNTLWRRVGNRTLLSAEGRRYHETVGRHIAISGRQVVPEPPHAVSIVAYLPDRRRRDVDNILKALLDPLYRAIGHDDSVITRLDIEKREPDELGPRVDVTIAPADHRAAGLGGEG